MRLVSLALVTGMLVLSGMSTAQAVDWQTYANPRFGYTIDIPPGFTLQSEADNGDGATFVGNSGAQLLVFGTPLESDLSREAENRIGWEKDAQWTITYAKVTKAWASFSGIRNGEVLYGRGTTLCGDSAAFFRLQYRKADLKRFNPFIARMVKSLRPIGGCENDPSSAPPTTGETQNR
jgi:hypothetical protein